MNEAIVSRRTLLNGIAGAATIASLPPFAKVTAMAATPSETTSDRALHVAARTIEVPKTISVEAQRYLAQGAARVGPNAPAPPTPPPLDDKAAWKAYIAASDKML